MVVAGKLENDETDTGDGVATASAKSNSSLDLDDCVVPELARVGMGRGLF